MRRDVERGERLSDSGQVEVLEDDAIDIGELRRFVIADETDADALDLGEVVVERLRGLGRCEGGDAGEEVGFDGPSAGAASLRDAGEEQRAASGGGAADARGGDLRRAGHHHLHAVLDGAGGVEQEDVLRAGAHIDREDLHVMSVATGAGWAQRGDG